MHAVEMSGTLYLVATPIGNYDDLTLRGARILSEADAVICEERRVAAALLAHLKIDKPLFELNEHSMGEAAPALVAQLAGGANLALISDHGTPLLQDPGSELVQAAIRAGIRIEPVPGASSVLAALVASGLPSSRFRFIGQLPAKSEARRRALNKLKSAQDTLVVLDAPYRLRALLKALLETLGAERQIAVACNLTLPGERFVRGTIARVKEDFEAEPFKGEFVVVVEGARNDSFLRSHS